MTRKPLTSDQIDARSDRNCAIAIGRLCELQSLTDYEAAHRKADRTLCILLITLGYEDVVEEFLKIRREYA